MGLRLSVDQHQPKALDVEPDRDHVGRDRAVDSLLAVVKGASEAPSGLGDPVGAHPGRKFHHTGEAEPVPEQARRLTEAPTVAIPLECVLHLLFQNPSGAPKLAQAVEVAEHGHVRIRGIGRVPVAARLAPRPLRRAHECEHHPAHHLLRVAPLGGDPEVPSRVPLRCGQGAGEERVPAVRSGRRKDLGGRAREEGLDLVLGMTDGGGRGDDLRLEPPSIVLSRAEGLDHRLVEPGHRAERAGDEVQLVLDHEIGRWYGPREAVSPAGLGGSVEPVGVVPVRAAEQRSGIAHPGERGELVHGRDQKRGEAPVERFVDGDDREGLVAREVALPVRARYAEIGRVVGIGEQCEGLRGEVVAAPRATLERYGRRLAARIVLVLADLAAGGVRAPISPGAEVVRRAGLAYPETDLEGPGAEPGRVAEALELERADEPRGAA